MSAIINILTAKLNYETANLIYNEYQDRLREVNYFFDNYEYYNNLKENKKTIETLLALSIFYKRLIANFDGFLAFTKTLHRCDIKEISVGSKDYTKKEIAKLYYISKNFSDIMEKYNISYLIFDYNETKDFLKNCKKYRLR
ncbi:hypothetical protein [Elizabethkingia ursingii]|uniref:hypothetical protein n=1 Tax=Elizabethkingia ursingii TaxID=1756150 RepID=UPI002011CD56|nr:hypothetical protein [Elizabethkingia ursingii]MCL1670516.1 hypothetical protein [Elizabethkingia ursingii]